MLGMVIIYHIKRTYDLMVWSIATPSLSNRVHTLSMLDIVIIYHNKRAYDLMVLGLALISCANRVWAH